MAENGDIEQQTQTSIPATPVQQVESEKLIEATSEIEESNKTPPDAKNNTEENEEEVVKDVKQDAKVEEAANTTADSTVKPPEAEEKDAVTSEEAGDGNQEDVPPASLEDDAMGQPKTPQSAGAQEQQDSSKPGEETSNPQPSEQQEGHQDAKIVSSSSPDSKENQDGAAPQDAALPPSGSDKVREVKGSDDEKSAPPAETSLPDDVEKAEEANESADLPAEVPASSDAPKEVEETTDSVDEEATNTNIVRGEAPEIKSVEKFNSPLPSSGVPPGDSSNNIVVAPAPSAVSDLQKQAIDASKERKLSSSVPHPPSIPEASAVSKATGKDTMAKSEEGNQPLNFEWTFGFNRRIPCLNLSDDNRSIVLYAASHIAVLYDFRSNRQKLLQGHGNAITCIACSDDKRWLVTGDKGPNSCVIVWDTYTGIPVQVLFDVNGEGVSAVGMSLDAKYVVTVSVGTPQTVSVWDWTTSSESPIHQIELDVLCQVQTFINFHPTNNELFVTNSDDEVIFYSWATGKLKCDVPFLTDGTFNRAVGFFNQSLFQVKLPHRALTTTSLGNIVVWDPDRPNKKNGGIVPIHKKRALKLVRVKERGLTALAQTDSFIVIGDTAGHVTFFDEQLNLVNSYGNFKIGPVNGITFNYSPDFAAEVSAEGKSYPNDSTIQASSFLVRDFIVSTKSAEIIHVEADGTKVTRVLKEHDAAVHALSASPTKPWICIGSYAGLLKLWDYEKKEMLATRVFDNKAKVQTLAFNHNGLQIAVGMASGTLHVIDAISFSDEVSFSYSRDAITHCVYSHDSKFLATADAQHVTTVFVYLNNSEWTYLGRHRAHYGTIQDISFGVDPDNDCPRLLTLGKDRVLVEYDLKTSSKDDLKLQSVDRVEQSAAPLCLAWYPPVAKESFLLTSNDQYKMKLYNTTTKMCRKTLLGPTYGSPARLISVVPTLSTVDPTANRMLCYATENKVGLQLLPLDGNPHRSASSIAHPGGVSRLVCSNDGKYVFTAGGREADVHMWSLNRKALEAVASLGGEDLTPFYGLLDGGREGEMFSELENYFYYAQLRSQGINTTEEREVSRAVPLEQVPFIMRALGYYPSEQEIEDLLNEVKFSQYVETGLYVNEVNLADLIKLYVNHRPAFGLSPDELRNAFEVLGYKTDDDPDDEPTVMRNELLSVLQRKGEHMTEYELAECLTTLLGYCPEGGSVELGETLNHEVASKDLEEALPESITPSMFANEVLGLNLYG